MAPLLAGHRRIGREADAAHPGNGSEPVLNRTKERDQLLLLMVRQQQRIDVNEVAAILIEPEVLVLQIAQATAQHRGHT